MSTTNTSIKDRIEQLKKNKQLIKDKIAQLKRIQQLEENQQITLTEDSISVHSYLSTEDIKLLDDYLVPEGTSSASEVKQNDPTEVVYEAYQPPMNNIQTDRGIHTSLSEENPSIAVYTTNPSAKTRELLTGCMNRLEALRNVRQLNRTHYTTRENSSTEKKKYNDSFIPTNIGEYYNVSQNSAVKNCPPHRHARENFQLPTVLITTENYRQNILPDFEKFCEGAQPQKRKRTYESETNSSVASKKQTKRFKPGL